MCGGSGYGMAGRKLDLWGKLFEVLKIMWYIKDDFKILLFSYCEVVFIPPPSWICAGLSDLLDQ